MATVPANISELDFTGNGVWTDAALTFPIQAKSHLVVTLLLDGETVATTQVLGTHYTVDAAPSDAPTVTMLTAPPSLSTLHVERTVPITQILNLLTAGPFSPATHTAALDKRTMVEQQLDRRIARLEGLSDLVSLATFDAQMVTLSFTSDADDVESTFTAGILTVPVVLGDGESLTGVVVAKVAGADASLEAVQVRDWDWAADVLTINFISGLEPGIAYTLSLLCTSLVPA